MPLKSHAANEYPLPAKRKPFTAMSELTSSYARPFMSDPQGPEPKCLPWFLAALLYLRPQQIPKILKRKENRFGFVNIVLEVNFPTFDIRLSGL